MINDDFGPCEPEAQETRPPGVGGRRAEDHDAYHGPERRGTALTPGFRSDVRDFPQAGIRITATSGGKNHAADKAAELTAATVAARAKIVADHKEQNTAQGWPCDAETGNPLTTSEAFEKYQQARIKVSEHKLRNFPGADKFNPMRDPDVKSIIGQKTVGQLWAEHAAAKRPSVPNILDQAARTFEERSKTYGDNYKRFGAAFLALFPNNTIPAISSKADADRLQLLMQILNKCTRYAENLTRGGHTDSARDICVYAAMLEEMTHEQR